jgi:RNA polymerase sigma factor (sigma-70 family)
MESRAFEELVVRYQGVVCGVAYAILHDRARSEEVAQEAFLLAWRRLADGPIGAGWICATARNLAWNVARRRTEVPMTGHEEPIAPSRDARDELIAREDATRAHAALAELPEKYRDAVVVYYHGDESMAAVAEALGISRANAKQRVHRGRELLREALGTVESTLRAARPAAAFTAACVALWAARGTAAAASTSTTPTSAASTSAASTAAASTAIGGLLASAAGWIFALATAGAVSVVVAGELAADSSAAPVKIAGAHSAATVTSHVAPLAVMPSLSATASTASPPRPDELVSLRAPRAPLRAMVSLLASEMNIPIRVEDGFEATIDCDATDLPALVLLDRWLAQANAQRTEVPALRIVQSGGSTDASSLGGDLMSLQLHDVPMRKALREIEAKLHVPIERDVKPMQLPGSTDVDGDLYIMTTEATREPELMPHVTIDVTNVTAGAALELVLEQTGLSYEHTTGFRIVAR